MKPISGLELVNKRYKKVLSFPLICSLCNLLNSSARKYLKRVTGSVLHEACAVELPYCFLYNKLHSNCKKKTLGGWETIIGAEDSLCRRAMGNRVYFVTALPNHEITNKPDRESLKQWMEKKTENREGLKNICRFIQK